MLRWFALVAVCAVLSSCQSISQEECVVADWRVIGEQDGAAGYNPQNRFARHANACAKAGIAADQTLWNQGYQQGLTRYCTPLNGLNAGTAGKAYANVCPVNLEPGFREGYDLGRRHNDIKRKISSNEKSIRQLEQNNRYGEQAINVGGVDQRVIDQQIGSNRREIRDLERDIGRLQYEIRAIDQEIENFRYSRAFQG